MKRPLRWWKFAFGLGLLSLAWSALLPRLEIAASLLHAPYVDSPTPPLPPVLAALATLFVSAWLLADLLWNKRLPLLLLPLLAAGLLLPGLAAGLGAPTGSAPGNLQLRQLLTHLAWRSACALDREGLVESGGWLQEEALRLLPKTSFRNRLGLRLPPRIRTLADAEGPVLRPLPRDPPGTLYLAVAPNRKLAWWSALGLDESGPALLRSHGKVQVEAIFPTARRSPPCSPAQLATR